MTKRDSMIEAIRSAGLAEGSFGEGKVGGYLMQQDPEEFAELVLALQNALRPTGPHLGDERRIRSYLQVGSAAGGCERFICEQLAIPALTIIDIGDHPQFPTWRYVNKPALQAAGVEVTEHIGDSHDEAAAEFLTTQGKFDLVGIDGDHTPAGVRMDWELVTPCLKPGTLVWFHDINHAYMRARDNGPWEVWEKLKARHKVHLETLRRFGIGLLEIV